jgi:hypothetical protein
MAFARRGIAHDVNREIQPRSSRTSPPTATIKRMGNDLVSLMANDGG